MTSAWFAPTPACRTPETANAPSPTSARWPQAPLCARGNGFNVVIPTPTGETGRCRGPAGHGPPSEATAMPVEKAQKKPRKVGRFHAPAGVSRSQVR